MPKATHETKIVAIQEIANALLKYGSAEAGRILARANYLFDGKVIKKQHCKKLQSTKVFWDDGFIDRYSGVQLLFPPVLRILSDAFENEFPFHSNWKASETHPAYWELCPEVDHFEAQTLGGKHHEENWFTTSTARNAAKQNWTLDQLGWQLHEPGDINKWDGLLGWFLRYAEANPNARILKNATVKQWQSAGKKVISTRQCRQRAGKIEAI